MKLRSNANGADSAVPGASANGSDCVLRSTATFKTGNKVNWYNVLADFLEKEDTHEDGQPIHKRVNQNRWLGFARKKVPFKTCQKHPAFVLWTSISGRKKRQDPSSTVKQYSSSPTGERMMTIL